MVEIGLSLEKDPCGLAEVCDYLVFVGSVDFLEISASLSFLHASLFERLFVELLKNNKKVTCK